MSAHDDDDQIDDALPTVLDPAVQFDPHARIKPVRAATSPGARPVAAEVISSLPPVRHDDPMPHKPRPQPGFDPHGRIDDSSRTAKWAPRELAEGGPTEEQTRRAKAPTRRGHDIAPSPAVAAPPVPGPPTAPMRVISMKTPADLEAESKPHRVLPVVKLRALSDIHQTPPRGMGNLAPPRDPQEARSRRVRDNVIWGSLAVILASFVTLAIWFLARR